MSDAKKRVLGERYIKINYHAIKSGSKSGRLVAAAYSEV